MPPLMNTVPSGNNTALQRLRCSPSGKGMGSLQDEVGDKLEASITSYVLLVDGSAPPNTKMRTFGGVLLYTITDMPFVLSTMDGEAGAIRFQIPELGDVSVK